MVEPVEVIRASVLDGVPHGFLGSRGGVSHGVVAGLNVGLGAGDELDAVHKNRHLAVDAILPGGRLVSAYQVHSAEVAVVDEVWDEADRPKVDALVTKRRGLVLGIVTADCAPILLADQKAGVIGAAHAGWRGAYGGVAEATVEAMVSLGATLDNICAAVGPCIAQASYEVGEDFRENFSPEEVDRFFIPGRKDHWQFDLEAFVAARLERAGLTCVETLKLDTYSAENRFFSYRRSVHKSEPTYGRQFSLIGLAD